MSRARIELSPKLTLGCVVFLGALAYGPAAAQGLTPGHSSGRADLIIGQGLHGALLGAEIVEAADIYGPEAEVTWPLAGAGVGILAGALLGHIDMGHAMMVNHGSALGLLHASVLSNWATRQDEYLYQDDLLANMIVGQLVGTAMGALVGGGVAHESGRIAMAGSVAMWTGILGALGRDMAGEPVSHPGYLAAVDLGYVAGYLLWDELHWSRTQVSLVDLFGLAALAFSLPAFDNTNTVVVSATGNVDPVLETQKRDAAWRFGITAGGVGLAGLAAAWLHERGHPAATVAWVPDARGGRMALGWQW